MALIVCFRRGWTTLGIGNKRALHSRSQRLVVLLTSNQTQRYTHCNFVLKERYASNWCSQSCLFPSWYNYETAWKRIRQDRHLQMSHTNIVNIRARGHMTSGKKSLPLGAYIATYCWFIKSLSSDQCFWRIWRSACLLHFLIYFHILTWNPCPWCWVVPVQLSEWVFVCYNPGS